MYFMFSLSTATAIHLTHQIQEQGNFLNNLSLHLLMFQTY